MPLLVNLHQLETRDLALTDELSAAELELDRLDELIQVNEPVKYDLQVQKLDSSILVRGEVRLVLDCECARCLKPFRRELKLSGTVAYLQLEGEEKVAVLNDCVDLTPQLREDILLEFPQHPLCKPDCHGLLRKAVEDSKTKKSSRKKRAEDEPSAWSELDKLKF